MNNWLLNGIEIVCFFFGLIFVLFCQKYLLECCEFLVLLREFLNKLDLSIVCGDEENELLFVRLCVLWCFDMLYILLNKLFKILLFVVMMFLNSVIKGVFFVFLNLKEISENIDLDMLEKLLFMKQRSGCVIKDVYDVCEKNRESLVVVFLNMCVFGDFEVKVFVNEIVEEVVVKKGVKRSVEELVGDDILLKYVESL